MLALVVSIMVPTAGTAGSGNSAVVPSSLLTRAQADPNGSFDVIITGKRGRTTGALASEARGENANVKRQFKSINGLSATLSGKAILKLARSSHVLSIVPDQKLRLTQLGLDPIVETTTSVTESLTSSSQTSTTSSEPAPAPAETTASEPAPAPAETTASEPAPAPAETTASEPAPAPAETTASEPAPAPAETTTVSEPAPAPAPALTSIYRNGEMWRSSTQAEMVMYDGLATPAIAIVDSGIDASKADFGGRVVASVNFSSLDSTGSGDAEGHGTMVAALAAGGSAQYPGVAPNSNIIDLKTANADGMSVTSDVIAAADWILANKDTYNIRVANFSMAGAAQTSFRFDPLDKAVERLWFSGIVVVAAAGNHGNGGAVDMSVAPANDPFIITVGAVDQQETADPYDDQVAPWSAFGYTVDGFSKPELVAPGRYLVSAVPMNSTIVRTVPDRVVGDGYIWMSGTSFSAPVVSGVAAQLLARHPEWTPDQVKGALMLTSAYLAHAGQGAGVGEIDAFSAAYLDTAPPNPNENFAPFIEHDSATGGKVFNEASWSSHVAGAASWSSANWSSAGWSSASWSSANWSSASWSSANWSSNVESMMSTMVNWSEGSFAP